MSDKQFAAGAFIIILAFMASGLGIMMHDLINDVREVWREGRKVDAMMGAFIAFVFAYIIFIMVFYDVFLVGVMLQ